MEPDESYERIILMVIVTALLISAAFGIYGSDNTEEKGDLVTAETPEIDRNTQEDYSTATFGVGCFWGVEARLGVTVGVIRTRTGYQKVNGSITDESGINREAVQVDYDPKTVSYEYLKDLISEMGELKGSHPPSEFVLADRYHQHYRMRQHDDLSNGFRRTYTDFDDFVNSTALSRINGYLAGYGHLDSPEDLEGFGLTEDGREEVYDRWKTRLRSCCH